MTNRFLFSTVIIACALLIFVVIPSCKKKEKAVEENSPEQNTPELSTLSADNISQTKVQCGGAINKEGSSPVTARGLCWSQQPNPTTNDKKTISGSGGGVFNSELRALTANTKYYIRAYATNSFGTAYGNEVSFTTTKDADGTVTDADGNMYHVLKIGNQFWLKENLRTKTYRNGDSIKYWSDVKVGGYCYLGDAPINDTVYGAMYNWYALADVRGIAPPGWHISSAAEWDTLIKFAGGEDVAGRKLKEKGTAHWNPPNDATDDFGFSGRGGAYRVAGGQFFNVGYLTAFWTSENFGGLDGTEYFLGGSSVGPQVAPKPCGGYIRCVKD